MTEYLDFLVNWTSSVTVTHEFKTSFPGPSRSGREQRIALRRTPRKSLQYKSLLTAANFRRFKRRMDKVQAQIVLGYDPIRYVTLLGSGSTSTPSGLTTVFSVPTTGLLVSDAPSWLTLGAIVAVIHRSRLEFRTLTQGGGAITFLDDDGSSWPPGTHVHPTMQVRVAPDMPVARKTNDAVEVSFIIDVVPTTEGLQTYGTATTIFNGREVFLLKPNWASEPTFNYQWPSEVLDYGKGRVQFFYPIAFSTRMYQQTYTLRDMTAAEAVIQFFGRMRGQQGEFYAPTWEDDLPLAAASLSGANTLTVAGSEATETYLDDTVHKALAIFFRDGRTPLFRQVTAVASAGADSLVTCDSTWPYAILPADVLMTSWLLVCRHASDVLTMEWLTAGVSQVRMTLKTLEALAPET
jgi:hypothetical protein